MRVRWLLKVHLLYKIANEKKHKLQIRFLNKTSVIKFFLRLREFNCFAVERVLILIYLPLVFLQAMPVVVSESRISDLAIRWKATFIVIQLHSPTRKKIYSFRRTIQKSDQDCPCNALQKLYKLSILSLLITVHSSIY